MTSATAKSAEFFKHPFFLCAASISTIVQIVIWIFEASGKIPKIEWLHAIVVHGAFVTAGLVLFGIVLVSSSFQNIKKCFTKIHDLNHLYRDTLAATSARLLALEIGDNRSEAVNQILARTEVETIDRVVSIIAEQFQMLIGRSAVVTFWRYDNDAEACVEQETSANGVNASRPFRAKPKFLRKHNSVFSENREKLGKCCHFYSPDLELTIKDSGYQDERPNYLQYYKSVLCVPIRFCWQTCPGGPVIEDLVGYLQVDTASRNRLNNFEHLFLLSAYADQLYNFLSIARRNFILS